MRVQNIFVGGVMALCTMATLTPNAVAGGFGFDCGMCGYGVSYAAPTYSYAAPTVTVVPHYVVQPNYVVQQTYVLRPTQYISAPSPCLSACGAGYVVNQGQYAQPEYYSGGGEIGSGGYGGYGGHGLYGGRYGEYSGYRQFRTYHSRYSHHYSRLFAHRHW
jgi:hypothetical protein